MAFDQQLAARTGEAAGGAGAADMRGGHLQLAADAAAGPRGWVIPVLPAATRSSPTRVGAGESRICNRWKLIILSFIPRSSSSTQILSDLFLVALRSLESPRIASHCCPVLLIGCFQAQFDRVCMQNMLVSSRVTFSSQRVSDACLDLYRWRNDTTRQH